MPAAHKIINNLCGGKIEDVLKIWANVAFSIKKKQEIIPGIIAN
jgi:hypothetical protein